MSAADGLKALEARALRFRATRLGVSALLAAGALLYAYCSGRSAGADAAKNATVDSVRHVLAESSAAIERRVSARATVIGRTDTVMVAARRAFAPSRARVVIVSDTTLRVDSVLVNVPMPVVETIARADTVIRADSIAYHAVAAQLADMTGDRDVWKRRALLDEANAPHPSRFGIKTGLAAGAALVVIVLHFVR